MPSPLPYIQFYHRDYLSSSTIAAMSLVAEAIYLRLLMYQWEDGALRDDHIRMRGMARASEAEFAEFLPFLDECFPLHEDGTRKNERMDADRERAAQSLEQKKQAGKASADARKNENPTPVERPLNGCSATDERIPYSYSNTSSSSNTNTNTESSSSTPKSPRGRVVDHSAGVDIPPELASVEGFTEAWEARKEQRQSKPKTRYPTEASVRAELKLLESCRDPVAVLNRAVASGWQGLNIQDRDRKGYRPPSGTPSPDGIARFLN